MLMCRHQARAGLAGPTPSSVSAALGAPPTGWPGAGSTPAWWPAHRAPANPHQVRHGAQLIPSSCSIPSLQRTATRPPMSAASCMRPRPGAGCWARDALLLRVPHGPGLSKEPQATRFFRPQVLSHDHRGLAPPPGPGQGHLAQETSLGPPVSSRPTCPPSVPPGFLSSPDVFTRDLHILQSPWRQAPPAHNGASRPGRVPTCSSWAVARSSCRRRATALCTERTCRWCRRSRVLSWHESRRLLPGRRVSL